MANVDRRRKENEAIMDSASSSSSALPAILQSAVLGESEEMPEGSVPVQGYDFNQGVDLDALLRSLTTTGFQATNFGLAVEEIKRMRAWRLSHEPVAENEDDDLRDPAAREKVRCTIFLGCTSNLVSAGTRETIRYLIQHRKVDCLVTTAGGIEEDFMKCLAPHYMGDFALKGAELRKKGINRIGNLLVPNRNYCLFEDWMTPLLDEMLDEQLATGSMWSPSKMIKRMGEKIDDQSSIYYWAAKNDIPVFCPAITDGSVGDMIYFHSFKRPGLVVDIAQDIIRLNNIALKARSSGMLIFGGGLVKHHICNANLMRNGANYAVFVNTGQEFDGSDSGAKPDEAISWGKVRIDATPVKVTGDATIIMPLLVAQTFAGEPREPPPAKAAAAPGGDVEYADALRQHITAALNEILTSLPEDPFKTMQKILFQASLGDGRPPPVSPIAQTPAMSAYFAKFDLQTHINDVVAKKGKGSGPVGGVKFMISDAGDVFTELSKKLKASGGEPMTAEELKAMDAAAAKAKREKEAKEQAERDAKDAENAVKTAAMEADGKKVSGGLHKFDASEVDIHGGSGTADDFMDAFGF